MHLFLDIIDRIIIIQYAIEAYRRLFFQTGFVLKHIYINIIDYRIHDYIGSTLNQPNLMILK